jgi:hypothetical protein
MGNRRKGLEMVTVRGPHNRRERLDGRHRDGEVGMLRDNLRKRLHHCFPFEFTRGVRSACRQ